jgi:hypothetical protein
MLLYILITLTIPVCNLKEERTPIDLTDMQLDLEIDLSAGKFNMEEGIGMFIRELTACIFTEEKGLTGKHRHVSIRRSGDELLINTPDTKEIFNSRWTLQPCETKKITCRSERCVENALKTILGNGSRDVDIKYRRNPFSVTITYTYQDC